MPLKKNEKYAIIGIALVGGVVVIYYFFKDQVSSALSTLGASTFTPATSTTPASSNNPNVITTSAEGQQYLQGTSNPSVSTNEGQTLYSYANTQQTTAGNTSILGVKFPVGIYSSNDAIEQAFIDSGYISYLANQINSGEADPSEMKTAEGNPSAWLASHTELYTEYPSYFVQVYPSRSR